MMTTREASELMELREAHCVSWRFDYDCDTGRVVNLDSAWRPCPEHTARIRILMAKFLSWNAPEAPED